MNILAINPGHNGSAAFLVDGELKFYIEEERLSRMKYDGNPYRGILEALPYGIDILVLGGTHSQHPQLPWTGEDPYGALVRKHNPNVQIINIGGEHHLGHAAETFYNSGFKDAVAVIVDGAGSRIDVKMNDEGAVNPGFETESIFACEYPANFDRLYTSFGGNPDTAPAYDKHISMDNSITTVKAYEAVSHYLGFGFIEAGKTMGLAPYGKEDENIPTMFVNGRGDKNLFTPNYPAGAFIDHQRFPYIELKEDPKAWHRDPSKVTEAAKNMAWKIQDDTQRLVGDLIEKAVDMTGKKNVVIAGGYGLNCVANYYLQKRFPDLNIWVDPISHDGGTAIGLAKLVWHSEQKDETIRPLENLYLGIEREENYDSALEGLDTQDVTPADVAKLIADRQIVTLFQGRSEAGPRALGNRSILYDPTDPNGKDHVNTVKGREWFRPFAGSMLQEHFDEWFETAGLEETPHMMYAMDFKLAKHGEVPAITHVDGTCRIQTVRRNQNEVYYDLINEFYKLSGVPILFNTSFNLAGEPLVETLEDAIHTIRNSDIEYLYLPEVGKLLKYSENDSLEIEEVDEEAA
jgi:carbamoyltransferase